MESSIKKIPYSDFLSQFIIKYINKYITSYKLWTLGENAKGDWDIMLITEFADQQTFDAVEPNFRKIFAKIAPDDITINGKTGNDLVTSVMIKKMNALPFEEKK